MYFTSGNYVDTFSFPSFTIPNYYNSIDFNLTGDSLENVLRSLIISTHLTDLPYTSTNYDTWDLIKSSDLNPGDSNNVILVYGYDDNDTNIENDRLRSKDSSCHSSSCYGLWAREHVFPKSLANPSMSTNMGIGTDVHNLRACDYTTNASRMYMISLVLVLETLELIMMEIGIYGDEWKGDVARIIMYMHLRYPTECQAINVASSSVTYDA